MQRGEGDARRLARGLEGGERRFRERLDGGDSRLGCGGIGGITFDADEPPAETLRHGAGGAGAVKGIEHHVAGLGSGENRAREQRLGFLGRMNLLAASVLQALLAGAERERPVGTHLHVFVAGLQRLVVEGVAAGFLARGPDQRLVGVGEAAAAEIRHRVGLAPDHVVEDPEAEILQQRADAEDVVVGADDPKGGGGLHYAAAGEQPGAGEIVIGREARKLVPIVVDRVDLRIVRALEVVLELQIVGGIGEDEVDRGGRKLREFRDAVADQDAIEIAFEPSGSDLGQG